MLCNRSDLGDLSGVQERICGTAECSSDIECDNEFSIRPGIRGAGYNHDGSEGRVKDGVVIVRWSSDTKCLWVQPHFPYI